MLIQAALVSAVATIIFAGAVYFSLQNNKRAKKEKELTEAFSN